MIAYEGIGLSFDAECRLRSVTGDKCNVVTQGPETFLDGADQSGMVASGKIGAADGTLKQNIADDSDILTLVIKDHMAWGVAGAMNDIQGDVAEAYHIALFEPAVRFKIAQLGQSKLSALLLQFSD